MRGHQKNSYTVPLANPKFPSMFQKGTITSVPTHSKSSVYVLPACAPKSTDLALHLNPSSRRACCSLQQAALTRIQVELVYDIGYEFQIRICKVCIRRLSNTRLGWACKEQKRVLSSSGCIHVVQLKASTI